MYPGIQISSFITTSGTTSNLGLRKIRERYAMVYFSREELMARQMWFYIKMKLNHSTIDNELTFRFAVHRNPDDLSPKLCTVDIRYLPEDPDRAEFIEYFFAKKWDIPGRPDHPTFVILPCPWIVRFLTHDLRNMGIDPRSVGVKRFFSTGGHLTRALKEMVRREWNAEISSSYSLVEVPAGLSLCEQKGVYHSDVTAYPEIVDPENKINVTDRKEGVMVFTSMVPFQLAMPLIRYWTGDLALRFWDKCSCGFEGLSVKLLGRMDYCLNLGDRALEKYGYSWISYIPFLEAFESLDEFQECKPTDAKYDDDGKKRSMPLNPVVSYRLDLERLGHSNIIILTVENPGVPGRDIPHLKERIEQAVHKELLSWYPQLENTVLRTKIVSKKKRFEYRWFYRG
jgi:hypothetical protein